MTIRRLRHAVADLPDYLRWAAEGAWILALSYFIAYLETLAVSNVGGKTIPCLLLFSVCLTMHKSG